MNFKRIKAPNKTSPESVAEMNYKIPPQFRTLPSPWFLQKNDIIASAETGTGKTAAFAYPSLQCYLTNGNL